jgi:hypothetical protein
MGQPGFFDLDRRLEAISAKGDALETIKAAVPREDFRADIEAVTATASALVRTPISSVGSHIQSENKRSIVQGAAALRDQFPR